MVPSNEGLETSKGLAILATTKKGNLDDAFLRRLRFIIEFPPPGEEQRRAIWARIFPSAIPVKGLDFGRLASLDLNGGSIADVAINAAFLAARDGGPVTMAEVLAAARAELRKLNRPLDEPGSSGRV